MKNISKILSAVALLSALTLGGCYVPQKNQAGEEDEVIEIEEQPPYEEDGDIVDNEVVDEIVVDDEVIDVDSQPEEVVTPAKACVTYIKVTGDNVNLRTGAGTNYAVAGVAEKNTLYASLDRVGEWYKTYYKNSVVYISAKYCLVVEVERTGDAIESVIAEGTKCLGVKYVYGATRYHDGNGNLLKGFTTSAFDCSSLMQYIFYKGAGKNLQVTTRTQIYQGTTVSKSALKRGDLIFFTNESRKNNSGIERVGHVALYLGDNLILHTASDYAKIEAISSARWAFYIQAQRII
jgi:cell wall-associated NlpC family hydrolase